MPITIRWICEGEDASECGMSQLVGAAHDGGASDDAGSAYASANGAPWE
jgi:hypothetical protein